jgi:hypothetical protein
MNAIAAPKSRRLNLLEGMALTALFQAIPTFGAAVLLLQLVGSQIAGQTGGAAIFVATATLIYALATPNLGPKFPRVFKSGYEPLFFDATLSFTEKLSRWRTQPATSLQLVTNVTLLSLLAVGVASLR